MTLSLSLGALESLMLVGVRMVAFLVVAPPFSHRGIPATVKVMLATGLALAVSPRVENLVPDSTGEYVVLLVGEAIIGAGLGFLVAVVFSAVQSAGALIDLMGGFSLAQGFDPMTQVNGAQFARLYQLTAVVILFASNGYQMVIGGLVRTFDALPLGSTLDLARLGEALTSSLTGMFLATLQIAGPLVVVLFLADVGLGLLTRVAPALNAFALGFPLKILLTLSLASLTYLAMPRIIESLTGTSLESMLGVTS
ncbi:flagellar biosynthetic protein FliR [Sanguibacter keddieii DSM 10542]|uniref:Flagellar biosynthetic protein FliR n=1 Tax=Sanguibacter keddieii (strain ATCC 51767 / DSM 10542 / NCFB 3025 / ST-74) TaxID=446469 RepID=D1BCL4_SANKS|nr:flagellar biosynthetic protein FliR [Sanguibacter keddieii]ACZ23001.1 flagellar biosynthetic protein FliR [Sanguibacter keddieii DSM 10542]